MALWLAAAAVGAQAQILEPAKWSNQPATMTAAVGDEIELVFTATIDATWYLYSSDFDPDLGPQVTTFTFEPNDSYELVGDLRPIKPKEKFDDIWGGNVRYFIGQGEFRQTIKVLKKNLTISGSYEYQVCTDVDGKCIPFSDDFAFSGFTVTGNDAAPANTTTNTPGTKIEPEVPSTKEEVFGQNTVEIPTEVPAGGGPVVNSRYACDKEELSGPILGAGMAEDKGEGNLLLFAFFAFLAGLTALLTPCVFPMIPMTVAFFTGQKNGKRKALFYGFCIILIYTLIGASLSPLMGPETANHLATEWLPNMIFAVVFFIFALSFLGMFEIVLPSSWVNKADKQADKGGLVGVFFMALTLVLVSFSCTGPIAGSLLVQSAGGEFVKPIAGMLGFSLAFALPFTLFAFFPTFIERLPKSGGWLNSVKVVLGFVELALAFKFISIADQAYHWGILDREVNIAIWIVISLLLGFYLLGKLRLPHDSVLERIPVPRLLMAIVCFTFVIYLVPGMYGAPLKALAGYLPPLHTHDFDLLACIDANNPTRNYLAEVDQCETPKYADELHLPHRIVGYFDYEQAVRCACAQDKPLFIDFTGHGCVNCREMEANVWSDPRVLKKLKEDYVVVALYVDDKTVLPEEQWVTSKYDNKVKKTIGKINADLQIANLNNNAQPYYVLVGKDEQVLVPPLDYEKDATKFLEFLDAGLRAFETRYEKPSIAATE